MKKRKTLSLILVIGLLALVTAGCAADQAKEGVLRLATPAEWTERVDGLPNFQEHYGFEFLQKDLVIVELGLAYKAVGTGLAEVGIGDATEGRIAQYELVVLEDDKRFFPAYNPSPVVRQEILDEYPELAAVMKELSSLLDLETLTLLNKRVSVDNREPEDVARDFLLDKGLISAAAPSADPTKATPIVVSGKTFAEALTLGSLTVQLLEDRGYTVQNEIGLGEVAMIRPALESGQIDIYWEYTGTGLMNIMQHDEVVTDPDECYRLIRDFDKKTNNIVWLDYAPANNTFVMFISKEVFARYGWTNISEMVAYIKENK
jgi:osmoprotectant transport system substrate-binding protein